MSEESYVDIRAVERLTALPRSWLYAKAAAGEIPHLKLGKYLRFDLQEVKTWLERHRRGANDGQAAK
jgi:excisionase family DNA binding protein